MNAKAGEVFRENSGKLFGYIMKMTGSKEDAEDCYQECFIKFNGKYHDNPTTPLLFTVARSVCIDHYRKNKNYQAFEGDIEGGGDPSDLVAEKESTAIIKKAVDMLDQDEKDILSMAGVQGLKYAEIADITGISLANVKVKVHRTRLKLKKILTELGHE
jgi:RNA polymerase sigma-70 factor (ECF subfamily)